MKKILIIPLIFTVLSCAEISKNKETGNSLMEKSHFRHLRYLLNVKNETAQKYWPDFGTSDFHQPIVYYSKENTFVVNPSEHILNNFDYQAVDSFNKMRVIQLPDSFNDNSSLKFNNSVSNDSSELHYMQPIMYFQSYKLTKKFLQGDLKDLEDWSIMVSHELFHGYQWSKPKMFNQARTVSMPGGPDKFLGSYHKDLDWYKESVEKGNDLLKAIWIDGTDLNQNLKQFDSLRNLRIERIKREYDVDIRAAEDYEITIEGNARYFESLIKRYLAKNRPDASFLTDEDKKSIVNMFAGYEVSKDKNLFNIYNSRYYYVIGYNISMILEKYEHDFKSRINTDEVSLLELLKELRSSQQDI
ncbi:hypothetical protein [Lutimonas zeaxanthinifaciens]|uniref:hypothetical protein n=1 Tax=Lutimonas zeaxanthinifaciens TaxID=3060215 RepID=UPI00265CB084|nr:hypothetical protein [Lutimonas sp. YSD2104]WKK67031.1 hypothetical protein QZH61_05265 [Lutimonas sp. YSD2104]